MLKLLITLIAIALVAFTANAQHLIVTNNNDTIEVKILDKDDSLYHVKRLEKPKREEYIAESLIKKIIAIGDDTLFNVFSGYSYQKEKQKDSIIEKNYEIKENYAVYNPQANFYLGKAGEHMNAAVTFNILGTLCIVASPYLIEYKEKENVVSVNGLLFKYTTFEIDKTVSYTVGAAGILLNLISILSWYECSENLKKASYQQKFSFKASPVGASVAFRF